MEKPEEAELRPELQMYWDAWHELRYDRFIGAMGGEGPIYYAAKSQYARDHGIAGTHFAVFRRLLHEMDCVHLDIQAAKQKADEEKRKAEAEEARRR